MIFGEKTGQAHTPGSHSSLFSIILHIFPNCHTLGSVPVNPD